VLLLFGGKAMMVASHTEHYIRTVTESYPLPSIVRLPFFVRVEYRNALLSRKNLFRRNEFRCQYCGRKDVALTLDHVMPKSRGGEESWENLVAACKPCNTKKGNRALAEAGMTMLKKPGRPSHITLLRQHYLSITDDWKPCLFMS
jgi:5-methylcytosine-specific restriction endonuclease McrA